MKVTQEPDQLNGRIVVLVGAAMLTAMVFGVLLAWLIQRFAEGDMPERVANRFGGRNAPAPEEINGMRSSLYASENTSSTRSEPSRLSGFGWADRQQQLVYIPLARAKLLYLERARAARATKPEREAVR